MDQTIDTRVLGLASEFVVSGSALEFCAGQSVRVRGPGGETAEYRVVGKRRDEWVLRHVDGHPDKAQG